MRELYVILPNKNISQTLKEMLQAAIKDVNYITIDNYNTIPELQNKRLLFVSQVTEVGTDIGMLEFFTKLMRKGKRSLEGSVGAVLLHSETEYGTKRTAQDIIFLANSLGCSFIGHPLVEAISTLGNFFTWQKTLDLSLEEICYRNSNDLVKRLMEENSVILENPKIVALYSSPHKTSNTLDLWRMTARHLEDYQITELLIEAGEVKDCHGCAYKLCTHYGNNNRCFYGGIMTEEVLPAIEGADAIIWLCPNYNDAIAANLTAVINRLTVLYRQMSFHQKSIFAVVVSGNSGSDSITKQLIGALNINKGFRLPPYFSFMAIANDPFAILKIPKIQEDSESFAENIKSGIKILI
jgi:NADPH-dependent FMN reductase